MVHITSQSSSSSVKHKSNLPTITTTPCDLEEDDCQDFSTTIVTVTENVRRHHHHPHHHHHHHHQADPPSSNGHTVTAPNETSVDSENKNDEDGSKTAEGTGSRSGSPIKLDEIAMDWTPEIPFENVSLK